MKNTENIQLETRSFSHGWTDIHSHILPKTDDGAADWDIAQNMLEMAYAQGVRTIIATPHYSPSQDVERLRETCERLNERAKEISEDLHILLGQEIMYFEELPEHLASGRALTLADSRYVLVEFRPSDSYGKLSRAVRQLLQASYLPVIAHAERYGCLLEPEKMAGLIHDGGYIQMNAGSLKGGFLDKRAAWCRKAVSRGDVHFLATDMHDTSRRPPNLGQAEIWLEKHGGRRLAEKLLRRNQNHILEDTVL